jgi:hypothetical protein
MTASAPAPARRRNRPVAPFGQRAAPDTALDCAAMVALLSVAVVGFGPAFGGTGYLVAGFGALLLGLAIALLGARLRANILVLAAVTLIVYMVFGGPLAVPATTIFGVVPSLETIRSLVLGVVFSWKDVLTLETPVGAFPSVLIVPFLSTLVATVLAVSFALRLRRAAWASRSPSAQGMRPRRSCRGWSSPASLWRGGPGVAARIAPGASPRRRSPANRARCTTSR